MSDAGASKTSGHASPGVTGAPAQPLIGFGQVRHTRLRPKEHRFSYATFFLLLPLRALARGANAGALAVNRRGAISFHDADHGDGRPAASGGALAWLDALLRAEGIDGCTATPAYSATPSSR